MLLREIRRRSQKYLLPSLIGCLVVYFCFHMIYGQHGLMAWKRLDVQLETAENSLLDLKQDHDALEHRVKRMRPETLCLDLLEERAKSVLGFVHPQEMVVLTGEFDE